MKKTFKKILCSLLVVVMCLTAVPLQGFVGLGWNWLDFSVKASALSSSGSCGYHATYTYNSLAKEVVISGTSSMFNYFTTDLSPFYQSDIKSVIIEDGITSIGDYAFWRCYNLSKVTLPNSLVGIGEAAFEECGSLKSIIIPNSVKSIEDMAFRLCGNLSRAIIGDNVTTIGYWAFGHCYNLKSVVIPNSIKTIHDFAFADCNALEDVFYTGTEEQWKKIDFGPNRGGLDIATIHYNYKPSYFKVSSDTYSVNSIPRKETATYKINLLDENSDFLPVDDVTVQNNTTDIVAISTKKVSDTEIELTVEPIKDGDASISLFNGDGSVEQFFNFTVYSNTTTYRADQVPVTNEKLKTNFSRGDLTVDNFEYYFDENKGKYVATMDVYNSSGAIGVVAAYTQDGKISEIEQVDPYIPLPEDFGEFLVYLGTGALGILKGENWNYRYVGYSKKTPITIDVPEDGYLTVSCDISADDAVFVSNAVSIAIDTIFKSTEIITALAKIGDAEGVAKKTKKSLLKRVVDIFNDDASWAEKVVKKFTKKIPKELSSDFFKEVNNLSFDAISELFKDADEDIYKVVIDILLEITKEEIVEYGAVKMATKAVKDKVIEAAEESLLKVASLMFKGGEYINLINSMLGAYHYNDGTGKTDIVFKSKGEDGFLCKDKIKVTSDIITDEVLLHTYVIKDTQKEDAFVRKTIYSDFNRGDGLRKEELSIDLNRIVEIHEISLWKNGQEVFDTFTATVEMNLPSYIDRRTCSIYRVEKDGTYTKLDTRIEGNKIIFETDHFSEYILTGVIEDLQETTPCDVHVYDEVRTEATCTEPGKIVYTCYCGDTYSETIKSNGHNLSDWYVVTHPKCETTGTEQRNCSVCDYSETQEIPATGHNFDDSKCRTCGFDKSDYCGCKCHKTGFISKIIWFITNFFNKLFKKNQVCNCGKVHF